MPFKQAVAGGRSVGVPGVLRMLALAHRQHGQLPWKKLLEPAIELAEQGFAISPRLHQLLAKDETMKEDPVARAYFWGPDGNAHPLGHILRNPELAHVLRQIANEGPDALHTGDIARAITRKVQAHPTNPGGMTMEDLAAYRAREREPLCFDMDAEPRQVMVCGFPPPSSGPLAIGQIIGLLSRAQGRDNPWHEQTMDPEWLHRYTEAARLAFADRAKYVADPDHVAPPAGAWSSLLDKDYLDQRSALISTKRMPSVDAGQPGGATTAYAPMPDQPEYGTSHVSVVDRHGNAVSMTTTIESGFGARIMVTTDEGRPGGFLLNNELTDFSFAPADEQGRPIANRVAPGKRPRSSMAPVMVFDKRSGELLMSLGSPGGAFIIHYVAKVLLGTQWWGLSPQSAIDLPNIGTTGGPLVLEEDRFTQGTLGAIEARGHKVVQIPLTSGLQALQRLGQGDQGVWRGGADPRREGEVMGQ
ncbi:gamma-glutamyltransferase [Hydrogenophaga sp. 5NK40-0174]